MTQLTQWSNMNKKKIAILLILTLLFQTLSVHAADDNAEHMYTEAQCEEIIDVYTRYEQGFDKVLGEMGNYGYYNIITGIQSTDFINTIRGPALSFIQGEEGKKGFMDWLMDFSSHFLEEKPDKERYAEIITNLICMQQGELAEQIENQNQFDDLKDGADYAWDVIDIATSFAGGVNKDKVKDIMPIIDSAFSGAEVIAETTSIAKYYQVVLQDYSNSKQFLTAINQYAENEELKDVSAALLSGCDLLLQKRLEHINDSTDILLEYEATFVIESLGPELLKNTDLYKNNTVIKSFVNTGEKMSMFLSTATATVKTIVLAGDIGLGTSDIFNRYNEMKTLLDIANALIKANELVNTSNSNLQSSVSLIQQKCDYYKMLITVHARGEYISYKIVSEDAKLLSMFSKLFNMFKQPAETPESWYHRHQETLTENHKMIEDIFNVTTISDEDAVIAAHQIRIAEYQSAIEKGYDVISHDSANYPYINQLALFLARHDSARFVYSFYDIDGNGTKELLLADNYTEDTYQIFDVYAFDGKESSKLFYDDTLAERSKLSIFDDGTMYIFKSGGAAYGNAIFYEIGDDGFSERILEEYTVDQIEYPETPIYNDTEFLSWDDFQSKLAAYREVSDIEWSNLVESSNSDITQERTNNGFDAVIMQYEDAVNNNFYIDTPDQLGNLVNSQIWAVTRWHEDLQIFYANRDIDSNGTYEFVVMGRSESSDLQFIFDVFTDPANPRRLFENNTFGYTTDLLIYNGGVFREHIAAGAVDYGDYFYKISSDGNTAELIDSLTSQGDQSGTVQYFRGVDNELPINEEEYNQIVNQYLAPGEMQFEWTQIGN